MLLPFLCIRMLKARETATHSHIHKYNTQMGMETLKQYTRATINAKKSYKNGNGNTVYSSTTFAALECMCCVAGEDATCVLSYKSIISSFILIHLMQLN